MPLAVAPIDVADGETPLLLLAAPARRRGRSGDTDAGTTVGWCVWKCRMMLAVVPP